MVALSILNKKKTSIIDCVFVVLLVRSLFSSLCSLTLTDVHSSQEEREWKLRCVAFVRDNAFSFHEKSLSLSDGCVSYISHYKCLDGGFRFRNLRDSKNACV